MGSTLRRTGRRTDDIPAASLAAGVVTALTLTVAFGALALGFEWFWVAFPVGFGGVLPAAVGYANRRSAACDTRDGADAGAHATDRADASEHSDDRADVALATLRDRYARGELTDEQFERRVERLVETEGTADTVVSIREQ